MLVSYFHYNFSIVFHMDVLSDFCDMKIVIRARFPLILFAEFNLYIFQLLFTKFVYVRRSYGALFGIFYRGIL